MKTFPQPLPAKEEQYYLQRLEKATPAPVISWWSITSGSWHTL